MSGFTDPRPPHTPHTHFFAPSTEVRVLTTVLAVSPSRLTPHVLITIQMPLLGPRLPGCLQIFPALGSMTSFLLPGYCFSLSLSLVPCFSIPHLHFKWVSSLWFYAQDFSVLPLLFLSPHLLEEYFSEGLTTVFIYLSLRHSGCFQF